MPRLLFVDDHPLYRAGFELALARTMPTLDVVVVESAEAALAWLACDCEIDLCLADVRLPGRSGFELLGDVGRRWPTIARAVLCSDPSRELAARARDMRLSACLSKTRDMHALAQAIDALFCGREIFDAEPPPAGIKLSDKRQRVLELGAFGHSNKEIARALGISERTVKDHWTHIFECLGVLNRVEAVSTAHRRRLL